MITSLSQPEARSIFWPLVLVAVGTLWLLSGQGIVSSSNVWAVLKYWPVLLIALGLDILLRWRWPILANLLDLAVVALLVAAIIFAPRLGLAAAGIGWLNWVPFMVGSTPGSGQVVTETRAISDFDAVTFTSFGDLTIQQGEHEGLTIEAEDNVLREIQTVVRGRTLHIGYADGDSWAHIRPTRPIRFTLTVVNLKDIELSGAGNILVNGLKADQIRATLSGAGNLSLKDLAAKLATFDLPGAGSLDASGTASDLEVGLSGVGSFKGADLQSQTAQVTLSGAGSATVWVAEQLDATVSGLGSVKYYGQPVVNKVVSGLGSVEQVGNK